MLISVKRSGFVKNFSVLLTGTAIAQAIPVLLQPLLRRLFDADVFALYAVYNSVTSMLIVVSTLRYEMAVVLPERDREGVLLVLLSLGINLLFGFLCFAAIALFPGAIVGWTKWPEAGVTWLYLVPLAVVLFSASQTLNYWLIRKKAFKASAMNRIFRRAAEGSVQAAGGAAAWQGALMWGDLAGRFVHMIVAFRQAFKNGFSIKELKIAEVRPVAKRYRDFPLFQALPALLNTVSLMLPVLLVNSYYSYEATAQFDLCRQVLLLPLALITTAMSQVLLQKYTEQRNSKVPIMPGFIKITLYTSAFAIMTILFFMLTGRPLFSFLFGQQWAVAGDYAAILAPAFMIQFVVSPVSTVIIALEKVRIAAVWQTAYFLGILGLSFFRHLPESDFFLVFTIINLVFYVIYWLMLLFIIMGYERRRAG